MLTIPTGTSPFRSYDIPNPFTQKGTVGRSSAFTLQGSIDLISLRWVTTVMVSCRKLKVERGQAENRSGERTQTLPLCAHPPELARPIQGVAFRLAP